MRKLLRLLVEGFLWLGVVCLSILVSAYLTIIVVEDRMRQRENTPAPIYDSNPLFKV